jgi:hypothetical protein
MLVPAGKILLSALRIEISLAGTAVFSEKPSQELTETLFGGPEGRFSGDSSLKT